MKNICFVTGTRAEYHLLYPLIKYVKNDHELNYSIVVTGAHLSERYGNTYHDIINDGFNISAEISILQQNDTNCDIGKAVGIAIEKFTLYFENNKPDLLVLLGDRYEIMGVATAATISHIPIAHLHGGETTEGAIDECFRHCISKMSYLHFTSCEAYRKRVIQLGESPNRVFNVGAIGIENIKSQKLVSKSEIEKFLNFDLSGKFALVTFHPVTLEEDTCKGQFAQLSEAFDNFSDLKILFTKSNADTGGQAINNLIDNYVNENRHRCVAVYSLGMVRYLSAMSLADIVIGNSSSGIIETPSFRVPTVNIGDRQKGRIQAENIINCKPEADKIVDAINKGLSNEFKLRIKDVVSPYGDGNVSEKIVSVIKDYLNSNKINLKKSFYDINFVY